ncbi:MAG: NUDIX domain-containing protein [Lentisphaeria bacterium]|nr:NUDIX domain-containing protein [Lentisphaeria bacterium]
MIHVAAAVIIAGDKVLLASRPVDKPPAGWEFPGGKLEPGETVAQAAIRELREELALEIIPGEIWYVLKRPELTLNFINCKIKNNSEPHPLENQSFCWRQITPEPPEGLLKNDLIFWEYLNSVIKKNFEIC